MKDLFETPPAFGVHARAPDASTARIAEFRLSRFNNLHSTPRMEHLYFIRRGFPSEVLTHVFNS
jgi:hypothetical protein